MMSLDSFIGIVVESAPVKTFADDFCCGRCGCLTVRGAVLCPRPGLLLGRVLHNPCKFSIIYLLRQGFVHFPIFAFPECPWTDCGGKGCRPFSIGRSLAGRAVARFRQPFACREGLSPVFVSRSPAGKGCRPWEVRGCRRFLQARKNLRPSGPRPVHALPSLALQAAGPSTRPDVAGVTFPRCDTLPGVASERRYLIDGSLALALLLSFAPSLSFCVPTPLYSSSSGKDIALIIAHSL